MYRPFLFVIVFFIPGIIFGSIAKATWLFFSIGILGLFCVFVSRNKNTRLAFFGIFIFFIAAFYCNFKTERALGDISCYVGQQQTVIGVINSSPVLKHDKVTYNIKTLYICEGQKYKKVSGNVSLSVLRDAKNNQAYSFGDVVRFSGKLKDPQGKRNPGGFDYKSYLLSKGISATVFSREIKKIGVYSTNPIIKMASSLNCKISTFYNEILPENLSSLLSGVVLGVKGNISREILSYFSDAGVMHLFAISGLHVGIIFSAVYKLFDAFNVSHITSFIIGSFTSIFYCFLVGLTPSVLRATIMIIILFLAPIAERTYDALNSICLAAFIILLINPMYLFSVSFQLSFCATLGIILFFGQFRKYFSKFPVFLRDSLSVIFSAQLLVWPVSAYYFHKVSIVGFLANIFIVPIVSTALVLGFIGGLAGLIIPVFGILPVKISGLLLLLSEKIARFSSRLPFSNLVIPDFSIIIFALYALLLIIAFDLFEVIRIKNIKHKKVIVCALIFVIVVIIIPFNPGLEVTFIDVGQGDSIFIKTPKGRTVLIDGGGASPYYSGDFDTGKDIIEPFLYAKGIKRIDLMVFTHFDHDHAGGLISILRDFPVDKIAYGVFSNVALFDEMKKIAADKRIKVYSLGRGDKFKLDDVYFEVLSPDKKQNTISNENDNSVVLKMTYNGFRFLFTGDLSIEGENNIMGCDLDVKANILKLGHHGSSTSTSEEFLSNVQPDIAVISVGRDNTFGHPSSKVLDLLEKRKIKTYRTDIHGAVTFKTYRQSVKIFTAVP